MTVAIYARVGSIEQTTAEQIKRCEKFIVEQGGTVHKIYTDEGFSAHDTDRPSLKKMLQDASDNNFKTIVTLNYARLFRNPLLIHELQDQLDELNITLKVVES